MARAQRGKAGGVGEGYRPRQVHNNAAGRGRCGARAPALPDKLSLNPGTDVRRPPLPRAPTRSKLLGAPNFLTNQFITYVELVTDRYHHYDLNVFFILEKLLFSHVAFSVHVLRLNSHKCVFANQCYIASLSMVSWYIRMNFLYLKY